jgi:hypothetical protein
LSNRYTFTSFYKSEKITEFTLTPITIHVHIDKITSPFGSYEGDQDTLFINMMSIITENSKRLTVFLVHEHVGTVTHGTFSVHDKVSDHLFRYDSFFPNENYTGIKLDEYLNGKLNDRYHGPLRAVENNSMQPQYKEIPVKYIYTSNRCKPMGNCRLCAYFSLIRICDAIEENSEYCLLEDHNKYGVFIDSVYMTITIQHMGAFFIMRERDFIIELYDRSKEIQQLYSSKEEFSTMSSPLKY